MPSLEDIITKAHKGNLTEVYVNNSGTRFKAIFIAPWATRSAWVQMRPFLAFDACHYTSRYKQTLMIAVGIDGNNQILPIAWAIAQGESYKTWL